MQQFVDLKRLADEVRRAALDRLDGVLHRAVSGDDDGDDVGVARDGGLDDRRAVDAGQAQVGEDDVEGEFCEPGDRRFARFGLLDTIAAVGQLFGNGLAQRGFVFDEQEMFRSVQAFTEPPIY